MAKYDYRKGKERIEEILDNILEIIEQNEVPTDSAFTFSNGYYSWVSGVFVDIRNSTSLFADEDKEKLSKVIRSFTSEIIEILRDDDNLREIGIRGDCVYAVYTTPTKSDVLEVADKTFFNTYMNMLNKLLSERDLMNIKVGIGMSTAQELVIKAGRKDVGINNKVWIGKAVARASKYSSVGNKNGKSALVYSSCSYSSFIDALKKRNEGKDVESWFTYHSDEGEGAYYTASVIKSDFDEWISQGMPE